jgi:non-homologous end joining protein Ku
VAALRKVPLKLGLISVTVGVQGAIDNDDEPRFNTLCDQGHAPVRIKQALVCPECKNQDRSTFKKGQETDDGKYVVVDPEALQAAATVDPAVKDAITLTAHPAEDLRFALPGSKVYYLAPSKGEHDTYALMLDLVERRTDIAMCAMFAVRGKPAMYQLGAHGGCLTLTEVAWPKSIREAPQHTGTVDPAMSAMAGTFLDTIVTPFDAGAYVDGRAEKIREFIAKQTAVTAGDVEEVASGTPDDLMAAMAAAIGAKPAAKKATRKKATAKKATAKKATARKAS